jgi:outer membrane immunogenic protein
MKKLLLGSVVVLGMSAPVVAADMAARPIARPAAFTNWTGCYVGGGAGTMVGHTDGFSSTAATTFGFPAAAFVVPPAGTQFSQNIDMTGITFGGYGGCQLQFGVWVVGAEGDWWGNNKEGQAFAVNGPGAIILPGGTVGSNGLIWSLKERWYATARGRLGYAVDKWLFYVTGGAAWVKLDSSEFCVNNPTVTLAGAAVAAPGCAGPLASAVLQTDKRSGWTVGGGVEYALPYNWSIRSEYLYIRIPSYTTFTPGVGNGLILTNMPTNLTVADISNHIFRAGLTYRFDFGKAVPAVTK